MAGWSDRSYGRLGSAPYAGPQAAQVPVSESQASDRCEHACSGWPRCRRHGLGGAGRDIRARRTRAGPVARPGRDDLVPHRGKVSAWSATLRSRRFRYWGRVRPCSRMYWAGHVSEAATRSPAPRATVANTHSGVCRPALDRRCRGTRSQLLAVLTNLGRHELAACRNMPLQGERDVRQQSRQAGQRLAIRPVRHQGHRDHQPDDQRIGHDPPPLPLPQQPLRDRGVRDRLDHPSPRWRSSSPSRTRSGSQASASTVPSRQTTAGAITPGGRTPPARPPPAPHPRRDRPPTANQQASSPQQPPSPQASPRPGTQRPGLHQRRQADKNAQGTPGRAWIRYPTPTRSPSREQNTPGTIPQPGIKPSSQPHANRNTLSPCVVLAWVRCPRAAMC